MIEKVDIQKAMSQTEVIFSGGGSFSADSYKKFKKDIFRFYCPVSDNILLEIDGFKTKNQKKFLYFGGNGNIVKGLDLIIEAFEGLPDLELYVCAPDWEKDFNDAYKEVLKRAKNIHFHGFIKVGGHLFNKLTAECGYVIFASCSEGAANSAIVCMRRGLVPILNHESGLDHTVDSGYLIADIHVESMQKQIKQISESSRKEFLEKSIRSYFNSFQHNLAHFSENFEKSLIRVLLNFNRLK